MKHLDLTGCPTDQTISIIKHFPVNKMRVVFTVETILGSRGRSVMETELRVHFVVAQQNH